MNIVFLPLSDDFLNVLKSSLAAALPNMKSSHRLEAFARAADYGSWASLLKTIQAGAGACTAISGDRFMEFVRSSGSSEENPERFFEALLDASAKIDEAILPGGILNWRLGNVLDTTLEGDTAEEDFADASNPSPNTTSSGTQKVGERTLIMAVVQEVIRMKPISEGERNSIVERSNTKIFTRPTQ